MADHDNFLEGEDETDWSSVSRLPSTRFVFIFFLPVPFTRFRSVHSFCLSCLKSRSVLVARRAPGASLRFRFLLSFSSIRPFPLHDPWALLVPFPCPSS